jgi:hypothetical protein
MDARLPLLAAVLAAAPALAGPRVVLPPPPLPAPLPVQGCEEGECYYEDKEERGREEQPTPPARARTTDRLVRTIGTGQDHCQRYTRVWRIDCLRDELERLERDLPADGDYADMRAAIGKAADELEAIAGQYADPAQPPVRRSAVVGGATRTTATPIRPVAAENLEAATAAAAAVVGELATTLLRSASSNAATAVHYERAAAAVDDSILLLRSS